jgi:glutathione synthase/RimK-type ligase-like ATP-grasp enzyme
VIFLCGIPSEPSLGLVIERLGELGTPHVVFNQRKFQELEIEFEITGGIVGGRMSFEKRSYSLENFTGVYTRLMDYRLLPEVEEEPENSPVRTYCEAVHSTLMQWYELAPARVMNRSQEVGLNYSKPFQAQTICEQGFSTPDTLVTNDPEAVLQFRDRHGSVIYKSVSYIRSIVKMLDDDDLGRLDSIRCCPTQFQKYIEGANVRVHTVAGQVFPTEIKSTAVDYRYAHMEGEQEKLVPYQLSDSLADRCLALSEAMGLEFGGVDLKITPDGEVYCLEVNPSPAFSYYELHTGQPISRAVAKYLAASC